MSDPVSSSAEFKEAMGSWPSGVCVAAARADGLVYGLTVSSLSSLSLEPPLVSICLAAHNRLTGMIQASNGFSISILADDQEDVSNSFARPGRVPTSDFEPALAEWTRAGLPVVKDAVVQLGCALHAVVAQGDHFIVIGRVTEATTRRDRRPLLYFRRRYRVLDQQAESAPVHEFETLLQSS